MTHISEATAVNHIWLETLEAALVAGPKQLQHGSRTISPAMVGRVWGGLFSLSECGITTTTVRELAATGSGRRRPRSCGRRSFAS